MKSKLRGFSLLELIAVLAILAIVSALVAPALPPSAAREHPALEQLRHEALTTGRSVTRTVVFGDGPRLVTATPDGRLVGPPEPDSVEAVR